MLLQRLRLGHFRNYNRKSYQFSPHLTVIVGPNTSGKTNLLEAIFVLAIGKSFRADKDMEMIAWHQEVARIEGRIERRDDISSDLAVVLTQGMISGQKVPYKKFSVNGVEKRMLDFVGSVHVTLFWPEDLELVTESPSRRRRYLDFVLLQIDREYRRSLISYEKGLRQRNHLLEAIREGNAHHHQLMFWDQLLVRDGTYITNKRQEYIDFVNNFQHPISNIPSLSVGRQFPKYQLIYDHSIISRIRLDQYKHEEVAAGVTLVGPHRDDFIFKIKNQKSHKNSEEFSGQAKIKNDEETINLARYGSRGEQRLGILWLKLAELSYIEKISGEKPILLLDDIFSELDHEHRRVVLEVIGKQQTIMTTTDEHFLEKDIIEKAQLIDFS